MSTRKHFELVAEIVRAILDSESKREAARKAIELFSAENPRFDKVRFLAACGVEDDSV